MKNIKQISMIFLIGISILLTSCSNINQDNNINNSTNENNLGLANPASTYCIENNGKLEIRQNANGEYGVCIFEDNSECEEWEFFRGECNQSDFFLNKSIIDFDSCVAAGNPTTRSIPAQCIYNKQVFIEELTPEKICNLYRGNWLEEFNECEYISKESCEENNGTFFECESACRNDPNARICTLQCVPVCKFNK